MAKADVDVSTPAPASILGATVKAQRGEDAWRLDSREPCRSARAGGVRANASPLRGDASARPPRDPDRDPATKRDGYSQHAVLELEWDVGRRVGSVFSTGNTQGTVQDHRLRLARGATPGIALAPSNVWQHDPPPQPAGQGGTDVVWERQTGLSVIDCL